MNEETAAPPPVPPASPPETEAAAFWVRGGALVIDMLILVPAAMLLGRIAKPFGAGLWTGMALGLTLKVSYQTFMIGWCGQTFGKKAAGVRVVALDGGPAGYGRALARALGYQLSTALLDIGFLVAAMNPQKRALHDFVAGTRTVFTPSATSGRRLGMTILGASLPVACAVGGVVIGIGGGLVMTPALAEARGNYAAAAEADSRLLHYFPRNAGFWNNRCWHRTLAGDLDGALADCDESLRLEKAPHSFDSRGMVLLKMKRYGESVASYGEALALDPKLAYSLYGRALAREGLGDRPGSDADLAAARALDANIDQSYRKLGFEPPAR